jgi:hypothetical protein
MIFSDRPGARFLRDAFFASPRHGASEFFSGDVGYPARWTGLVWRCTVGALEGMRFLK